jgi:hypothetical protein
MGAGKAHRVLVCGSRFYQNREELYRVLDAYHARIGPKMFLINGGAPGADTMAREWAVDRKVDHITLYARWQIEGKAAGPIRNSRMLKKGKPGLCLAFHEDPKLGRGTADMVAKCERAGVKVKRFIDVPRS